MANFRGKASDTGEALVHKVLDVGVDGVGKFKSAKVLAAEALVHTGGDVEAAVDRLVRTHVRLAGTEGFVTGLPGGVAVVVALPADLSAFYILAGRMVAAIAHLRGYDVHDDDVRSAIVVCLLGASATTALKDFGIELGQKSLAAALKKVPGKIYIEINKKVDYRLITKAGEKGLINVGKLVPFVGGPIGLGTNVIGMRSIAGYARKALPPVPAVAT